MTGVEQQPPAGVFLEARGLAKTYRRGGREVSPLAGVDLELRRGSIEAVVGPSGTGKSTLARCLTLLEPPDDGVLRLDGVDAWQAGPAVRRRLRRGCQYLAQEPGRSVSPRWSVEQVVCEPMVCEPTVCEPTAFADEPLGPAERRARAAELLAEVELDVPLRRRARDLSGGQLQRLVLARALACDPRLMVLDETLTGLDLSLRARIVERLEVLRRRRRLALLLISHDVPLMRHLAERVWRLEGGRLVALTAEDFVETSP